MFSTIEHVKPAQLIGFIGAIDWGSIDYQTRLTVLHEVNEAITKFRESQKLAPIDDSLPGVPPNAFQIIRGIITAHVNPEFPAPAGEPTSGNGQTRTNSEVAS
jgi:hypothetical protein